VERPKKAKTFCLKEEEQCCRSFMHTSTDMRRGTSQMNFAFWSIVVLHYNRHKHDGG
jgi:hypothetical protein